MTVWNSIFAILKPPNWYAAEEQRHNKREKEKQMMREIRFLMTNKCNYHCFYCHNEFQGDYNGINPEFDLENIFKKLKQWRDEGFDTIKFSGGEPLLETEQLRAVTQRARKDGFQKIILLSNLSLGTADILQTLISEGVNEIRVNIPHFNPDQYVKLTGSSNVLFDRVVRNCQFINSQKIRLRLNVVFSDAIKDNFTGFMKRYIQGIQELFHANGIAFIVSERGEYRHQMFKDALFELNELFSKKTIIDRSGRVGRILIDGTEISLHRCTDWNGITAEISDALYIVPPGKIVDTFRIGRAYK